LILALSYSSKWDIVNAFKNIATRIKSGELEVEDINEEIISNNLTTHLYPNPELLIRTSGEYRLSNFLLWELAYSEFHFTEVLWPDFSQEHLYQAIIDYQSRERRFGKTSEQIVS
jgi:undecaprenyl diphosphate synthase